MRRALHPGRAGTWGPVLVVAFGVGLILGGVFPADPSLGFPAGAPQGTPAVSSWHALMHNLAPGLALDAAMVASFVFARRFSRLGQRGWVAYCAVVGVALIVLSFLAVAGRHQRPAGRRGDARLRPGRAGSCPVADGGQVMSSPAPSHLL
ncbi:MAG: DUF998 domain-containing protein, partial [Pseudonocardiaceae bacterium]